MDLYMNGFDWVGLVLRVRDGLKASIIVSSFVCLCVHRCLTLSPSIPFIHSHFRVTLHPTSQFTLSVIFPLRPFPSTAPLSPFRVSAVRCSSRLLVLPLIERFVCWLSCRVCMLTLLMYFYARLWPARSFNYYLTSHYGSLSPLPIA